MTLFKPITINQKLDALKKRDKEARLAIVKLCERISILEESNNLHHFAITHCTGGCQAELHRKTPFDS